MEFGVLGPVELWLDGGLADAGHARQRAVLAVLVLEAGRAVPLEVLIDRVWGEDPPRSVRNLVYGYAGRLKALIADGQDRDVALSRRADGYLLHVRPGQVDAGRFRALAAEAKAAADDGHAGAALAAALALWRGQALAGLDSPWLNGQRARLELERAAAGLDLNDLRLRRGEHATLVGELVGEAVAAPADERLIGQLMLALYRCGRQAEALLWFDQTRRHLAGELGTDPGPELRTLHQQILRADPGLAVAPATASRGAAPVPRQLPADVRVFTGRAAELAELDRLLATPAPRADTRRGAAEAGNGPATAAVISAVSGTAGVGKTALAVHWAHSAADRFPDGQLYVNLRGYDAGQPVTAADALAGFLRALAAPGPDIPPDQDERAARYRSLLAGKRMLIVLDNASQAEQVRPLLPGTPGCAVLVTSRDALAGLVARDGAARLNLDLLPLDEAVTLLAELIGQRASADPDAAGTFKEPGGRSFLSRESGMVQSSPQESWRVIDGEAISRLWTEEVVGSLREMTPGQAARRVGQELQFGAPIGLQRLRSYPALLILGWLLGFAAAFVMLLAGVDSNWGPSRPLVLACFAVLLLIGCFMIAVGRKRRVLRGWLARYRYGYAWMRASDPGPAAVRWASVTEVSVTYRTTIVATGWPAGATVKNISVGSFSARPFIGWLAPDVGGQWEAWTLMRDALQAAGPRLVTAMIEAYESGRLVAFGPVRIDQQGVASPSRDLVVSWADIHAIRMRHIRLARGGSVVSEIHLSCHGRAGHRKIVISGLPNGIFLPSVIAHAAAQHGVPVKGSVSHSMLGQSPARK
jgi:DNA-binding SARP family transcriptional activator